MEFLKINILMTHYMYKVFSKCSVDWCTVGQFGITLNVGWSEPDDPFNPDHLKASERALQFDFGWFAHPIVINGNYPQVMIDKVAYKSKVQNFSESRLTPFTEDEQRMIKGKEHLHVVYQYHITQYGII